MLLVQLLVVVVVAVAVAVMDVVLEACDALLFDRFWATVLPAKTTLSSNDATATFSSMREGATLIPRQRWVWEPATKYFSFPPSEYAWESAWSRDYTPRQFIELFLIVWYGVGVPSVMACTKNAVGYSALSSTSCVPRYPMSSCSTRPRFSTRSTSRTNCGWRLSKHSNRCLVWPCLQPASSF